MNARVLTACVIATGLLGLCAPGCLEHKVKTTVNTDGTCERIITLNLDAQQLPTTPFPLPAGPTWDTSWTRTHDQKYVVTFSKRFKDFEELSREYVGASESGKIRLTPRVRTVFRWFYTYYEYVESYGRFTSYTLVPPQAVLTEEEIQRLTYGDTSQTLKYKKEEWVARNLFEALYAPIKRGVDALGDSLFTSAVLAERKEDLFRLLVGYSGPGKKLQDPDSILQAQSSLRGKKVKLFSDSGITEQGLNAFTEVAARTLRSDAVWKLRDSIRVGFTAAEKLLKDRTSAGESFSNSVVLPGILLESNAPEVQGSAASWKFSVDQLELRDYDMHVTSRVVNEWAIAVTAIVILALIGLLILPLAQRRRHAGQMPTDR